MSAGCPQGLVRTPGCVGPAPWGPRPSFVLSGMLLSPLPRLLSPSCGLITLQAGLTLLPRHAPCSLPTCHRLTLALHLMGCPLCPFTFGSRFLLSSQWKKNKVPKNQEQEFGPTHRCLDGVFVLVTSLATVQPWPSVLGPMSREGLSRGSECAVQLGLDPLRGGQWVWWALGLACLLRGGSRHVYNRRLFSFCP